MEGAEGGAPHCPCTSFVGAPTSARTPRDAAFYPISQERLRPPRRRVSEACRNPTQENVRVGRPGCNCADGGARLRGFACTRLGEAQRRRGLARSITDSGL